MNEVLRESMAGAIRAVVLTLPWVSATTALAVSLDDQLGTVKGALHCIRSVSLVTTVVAFCGGVGGLGSALAVKSGVVSNERLQSGSSQLAFMAIGSGAGFFIGRAVEKASLGTALGCSIGSTIHVGANSSLDETLGDLGQFLAAIAP